jgi:hypothetical protein
VSPDGKSARVFKAWRGDGLITTASDVIHKYIEMKGNLLPTVVAYDYSAKDLHTYAQARGHALTKADKSQDTGVTTLNTLFRNEMLKIQSGDLEREKLIVELTSVLKVTSKTMAKDDLCDALKYAVCFIPWNWEAVDEFVDQKPMEGDLLLDKVLAVETETERRMRERRGKTRKDEVDTIELEMEAWNELYEC